MAGAHTETVLNIISKPDLVKLILNIDVNLGSQIAKLITEVTDILAHSKKLETDGAVINNVNNTLVKSVVITERQCCGNALYLRKDMLEVAGVLKSVRNKFFSGRILKFFRKLARIYVIVTFTCVNV